MPEITGVAPVLLQCTLIRTWCGYAQPTRCAGLRWTAIGICPETARSPLCVTASAAPATRHPSLRSGWNRSAAVFVVYVLRLLSGSRGYPGNYWSSASWAHEVREGRDFAGQSWSLGPGRHLKGGRLAPRVRGHLRVRKRIRDAGLPSGNGESSVPADLVIMGTRALSGTSALAQTVRSGCGEKMGRVP